MKNKSLIPNIAVLLVVALVCVLTGQIYLQQQKDDVLYTENPNITGVIRLSDYNPNLKDTPTWISMSLTAGSPEARR